MNTRTIDEVIISEIQSQTDVSLDREGTRWVLVLRRHLRHSPQRVWQLLTEPDQLARWSPIVPDRPLTTLGPALARENPQDEPVDVNVLVVDPPRLLVHRWRDDVMSWSLSQLEGGTLLELRQTFDNRAHASSYAAGWRVCIGTLAATYDDVDRERVVGDRANDYGWAELHEKYEAQFTDLNP